MPSEKTHFPSDRADKFMLRFPDGMRDQIAELAKANGRSMNAEIIQRLQISLVSDSLVVEEDADLTGDEAATALALKVLDLFGNSRERAHADRMKEQIAAKKAGQAATAMLKPLESVQRIAEQDLNPPRTPKIPGVNAPKEGLGSAPKEPKARKPRTTVQKRKVVADDKETGE
ncbi:hypothetical protein B9P52_04495 [Achromobacter denitrificans]|uniref:Arc family DNA-binding protein n=1 Tax=Achromobacter denitrificans TaxID=32002 RepID=UPI000B4CF347|nr:Arc family DNA-binding protein [Achromobacter denitrificans]ASC63596.1 hypothetical protein B9P52_04495 [Achromobacter denitrificans]